MAKQNMLLFLIACLELNLALFNLLLVSYRRRTILMRDIAFSRTSYRRFGSNTRLARARRFWIRPGRTSAWWDNFVSQTVVQEEWKENFRMSRSSLLKLSEELWPYIEGKSTSQRIRGVLVWTVGNAMKKLVWTRINWCVFGKTNPYTFECALVWTSPNFQTRDLSSQRNQWTIDSAYWLTHKNSFFQN